MTHALLALVMLAQIGQTMTHHPVRLPLVEPLSPGTCYESVIGKLATVEPMDVPAIKLPTEHPPDCSSSSFLYGAPQDGWYIDGEAEGMTCSTTRPLVWTCADKQRILLTDESGGKHCVRFWLTAGFSWWENDFSS
jgi:hypothetical protein